MSRAHRAQVMVGLALVALLVAAPGRAHESNGTPAAKAFFAHGDSAAKAGRLDEAVAAFRKAIDADPDFVDAHQRFIETTQRLDSSAARTPSSSGPPSTVLEQLYTRWSRQQPKRAVYRWALGVIAPNPEKADAYFREALTLDPAFARADFLLAKNADLRGDFSAQRDYLHAAVEANPTEPRYLVKYAQAFKRSDPARFRELGQQVVEKFPTSQAAAEALYSMADAAAGTERRALLERSRASYPADKFSYGSLAMDDLYEDMTSPSDALSVAQQMVKAFPSSKTWARRVALQGAMVHATALVADRRFSEAFEVLDAIERPSGSHGAAWALLRATAANGAGRSEQAYASLVESAAAVPDDRIDAALREYAKALDKTPRDIDADVWRARDSKATAAAPFELPSDRSDAPVKLADFRGRVVLVAFWFPG